MDWGRWLAEGSEDREVGRPGGVRGMWKVRQTAGKVTVGQPTEDTHTYPGWGGPFRHPIRPARGLPSQG